MDAFIPFKLFFLLFLGALSRSGRGEAAPADLGSDTSGLMANVGATEVAVTEGATTDMSQGMASDMVGNGGTGAGKPPVLNNPDTSTPSTGADGSGDIPQTPAPDSGISDALDILDDLLAGGAENQTPTLGDTVGGVVDNLLYDVRDVVAHDPAYAQQEEAGPGYEPVGALLDSSINEVSSLLEEVLETADTLVSNFGQSLDQLIGPALVPGLLGGDHADASIDGEEDSANEGTYDSINLIDTIVDAGDAFLSGLTGAEETESGSLLGLVKDLVGTEGETQGTVSFSAEGDLELDLSKTEIAVELDGGLDMGVSSSTDLSASLGVDLDHVAVDLDLDLVGEPVASGKGETAIGEDLDLDLGVSHLFDLNASVGLDLDFNLEVDEPTYLLADKGNPQDGAYDHDEPLLDLSLDLNLGLDLFPEAAHEADAGGDLHGGLFPEVTLGLAEMDEDQADENDAPETVLPIVSDLAQMFGLNDLPLLSPDEYAACEEEEEEADHDLLFFI